MSRIIMKDIEYIEANFIEQESLCELTNITLIKLNELIDKELIPDCSYKIESKKVITSPLGDKKELIDIKKYFPKSVIVLIEKNISKSSEEFKNEMKKEFIEAVLKYDTGNLLYKNKEELDELFENEWSFFVQGVYGICTLHSSPTEIAKKGIVVQKLKNFLEKEMKSNSESKDELMKLNEEYNEVANLFAPYQRENSSRGIYIDKQLEKYDLAELIKEYN